jgi:hypothetical protein
MEHVLDRTFRIWKILRHVRRFPIPETCEEPNPYIHGETFAGRAVNNLSFHYYLHQYLPYSVLPAREISFWYRQRLPVEVNAIYLGQL